MALSSIEMQQLMGYFGMGKYPLTGGPSTGLRSVIAQTMPYEITGSTTPTQANMYFTPIFLTVNQVITNINFVTTATAASSPTHTWYALYDDGRGSGTANQLALLGQTADNGSSAYAANSNIGYALTSAYTTTYTGIYYAAFYNSGTTAPTMAGTTRSSTAAIQIAIAGSNDVYSPTLALAATATAPNPSGALTNTGTISMYAYVS